MSSPTEPCIYLLSIIQSTWNSALIILRLSSVDMTVTESLIHLCIWLDSSQLCYIWCWDWTSLTVSKQANHYTPPATHTHTHTFLFAPLLTSQRDQSCFVTSGQVIQCRAVFLSPSLSLFFHTLTRSAVAWEERKGGKDVASLPLSRVTEKSHRDKSERKKCAI